MRAVTALRFTSAMTDGSNEAARDEIERSGDRYLAAFERTLAPFEKQIRASGLSCRQLAKMVQKAAAGFQHDAKTNKQLQELLASLKASVLAVARAK